MNLALALLAVLSTAQTPAPGGFSESRFHRVHLRNGNFVDGELYRQTRDEVTLRISTGTITINRDLVDKVEFVKMRSILETTTALEKPSTSPTPTVVERREPFERPRPSPSAPAKAAPRPYAPSAPLKIRVDALVVRLLEAAPEDVDAVLREIVAVEGDTTAYVAALMETRPPEVGNILGPFLKLKPERTAIPYLLRLLVHPSGGIRMHAVEGLAACAGPAEIPALAGLSRDADPLVRAAAVTALSEQEDEAAFDALAPFVADADREVRTRALGTLTLTAAKFQRSAKLVEILTGALQRSTAEARQDVLLAMGRSGEPGLSSAIVPFLKDASAAMRTTAATALGDLGDASTGNVVLSQLQSESDDTTRAALAAAAVKVKAKEAFPFLIAWLEDDNEEVKTAALRALKDFSGNDFQTDQAQWEAWWEKNKP